MSDFLHSKYKEAILNHAHKQYRSQSCSIERKKSKDWGFLFIIILLKYKSSP